MELTRAENMQVRQIIALENIAENTKDIRGRLLELEFAIKSIGE